MSDFLERYKRGLALQQGTIGQSFSAIDLKQNRPVVIKHIGCSGVEAAAAVLQEWARLLPLNHPLLVEVFETDLDELDFYLALEYVEGTSLRRLIPSLTERTGRGEELARILGVTRSILEGLGFIHAAQVAHGDLCPENIWLGEQVVILDSGLAQLVRLATTSEDPRLRSALRAIPIGSPAYRAPELALGASPTFASDLYSLGVILYESLTGQLPDQQKLKLPEKLTANGLLYNLLDGLLTFRPDTRFKLTDALNTINAILHTPPGEPVQASAGRKPGSGKLESQEIEVYQRRAALLLEKDQYRRARLRRSIANHFARKMKHAEALEECRAGQQDAASIADPAQKARAIASLIGVEMQVYFNQARLDEMISLGHQALRVLSQAGLAEEEVREAAQIYLKLARCYYRRGELDDVSQAIEKARQIAQATRYAAAIAEADAVEAMNLGWTKGQLDEGIALAERCVAAAEALDMVWLQSEAHRVIGGCYQYKNSLPEAALHYRKAFDLAEQVGQPDLIAAALYNLGLICEIEGDFTGCENYLVRSLEVARQAQLPRPQAIAYKGLNLLYTQLGRLPEAYEQARLHLRLMQELSDQQLLPDANCQVALVCQEMGRLDESEHYIDAGRKLATSTGNDLILIELERLAATLRLKQGRLDEAEQFLAAARRRTGEQLSEWLLTLDRVQLEIELARLEAQTELAQAAKLPIYRQLLPRSEQLLINVREVKPSLEAGFLTLYARILALADYWDEAETTFKQAIQQADERKQRLSLALALHLYGQSLLEKVRSGQTNKLGRRGRAIGLLANAKAVYSECGAQPGLAAVNVLLEQAYMREVGR